VFKNLKGKFIQAKVFQVKCQEEKHRLTNKTVFTLFDVTHETRVYYIHYAISLRHNMATTLFLKRYVK
jgi:hypothetical protein